MLSPVIVSIFENELTKLVENSAIRGIQLFLDIKEIILLLLDNDLVLIADIFKVLQSQLNI